MDIDRAGAFEPIQQAGQGALPGFERSSLQNPAPARNFLLTLPKIHLAGQGHVAIFSPGIAPGQSDCAGSNPASRPKSRQTRPSGSARARNRPAPGRCLAVRQRASARLCSRRSRRCYWRPHLPGAGPVPRKVIIFQLSLQGGKLGALQHHVPFGVGQDFLLDPVAARPGRCWSV